jgi:hypothetical protein
MKDASDNIGNPFHKTHQKKLTNKSHKSKLANQILQRLWQLQTHRFCTLDAVHKSVISPRLGPMCRRLGYEVNPIRGSLKGFRGYARVPQLGHDEFVPLNEIVEGRPILCWILVQVSLIKDRGRTEEYWVYVRGMFRVY